jgi:hypothetical protein
MFLSNRIAISLIIQACASAAHYDDLQTLSSPHGTDAQVPVAKPQKKTAVRGICRRSWKLYSAAKTKARARTRPHSCNFLTRYYCA